MHKMNANTQIAILKMPVRSENFGCIKCSIRTWYVAVYVLCHYKYISPLVSCPWQAKDCSFNSSLLTWHMRLHGDRRCLSRLQLFWWRKSVWLHACVFLHIILKSMRQVWRAPVHIDSLLGCLFHGLPLSSLTCLHFLIAQGFFPPS